MSDKTIYKYPLLLGRQKIMMPFNAKLLTVQLQDGMPHLWALVDRANVNQVRHIQVWGTGHALPDDPGVYVGTIQQGPFVWHVFDATGVP